MGVFMRIKKNGIILMFCITVILSGCSGEKSAKQYYKDGIKYLKEENNEEAKNSLKEATLKNPNRAEYCIAYGYALIKTGDFDMALKQFDQAILEKDNLVVKENNKSAYRGKGIAYIAMSDYAKAINEFELALNIDESPELNIDIMYYKGNAEEKVGQYEEAIKTYSTILEDQPKEADLYGIRANLYYCLGDYEKSLADYDKALALKPNEYEFYFGKYFMLLEKGDEVAAQEVLAKAEAINTKEKDSYNMGKLFYYQGNLDKAKEEFTQAIELGQTSAYFYLGEISEKEKDYKQGIINYELFIGNDKNSKPGIVYNQLGVCYIQEGDFAKALEYIQKGIGLNDHSIMKALQYNEVVAYERLIMFDKAFDKAKEYIKQYPDDKLMLKEMEFIKTRLTN